MKLAEALLNRGALQDKLSDLRRRLNSNALIQEGELPAESPEELMKQTDKVLSDLEDLVFRINMTNARTVREGETLTKLLAKRDRIREDISIYREFLERASDTGRRARGSEIRIESSVPVKEIQKTVDKKSQELRKLEIQIQEINWTTDLIEEL